MVSTILIISAIIAIVAVALGAAYTSGAADPIIEKIGIFLLKAKAEAEAKKLQAQGLKEGEDFLKSMWSLLTLFASYPWMTGGIYCMLLCIWSYINSISLGDLKGNQQADQVKESLGGIGGGLGDMKKGF